MSKRKVALEVDDLELTRQRAPWLQRVAASQKGMVASAHFKATEAAQSILAKGGNAIDAAVCAAFALGVCEPAASGLGGQTMALFYNTETRKTIAFDGSSRAPHRVPPGELRKKELLRGHKATTVPSTPAVLAYLVKTYGTMSLADVMQPAVKLAEKGFKVTELKHFLMQSGLKYLKAGSASKFFLKNGRSYKVGAILKQPVLAETLQRIVAAGVEDFYQGEIAKAIHEDMVKNDGFIRDDDLAQIPWPIERNPISCRFRGNRVLTFGEPGAGRTLVEMLNVTNKFPEHKCNPDTPQGALLLSEIIRRANLDRKDRPFDPNFYPQVQGKQMLTDEYAELVVKQIRKRIKKRFGGGDTTHLSVMDRKGNVVSLTQSIERVYGSFEASPKLGFLYNNYMSAFEYTDMTHPNYLRPAAVPWASVAPTIVFKGRTPWMAIGSPGSERIAPAILQVLMRLQYQSPYDAVAAPRLHCSIGGKVSLEASRMRDDIPKLLKKHKYKIDPRNPYSFYLGCVQLVMNEKKGFIGVADPRRDGSAGGP
ncbi:MAG: gamma-glutamyltransferase [Deltaproteobacteria bacterium]|jgi:gamma-glutamyltranspeptidase/glutathione hydrolase|nr:gamma-glutamyltransferase [Deltaproteobacteria bacterium]